MRVPKVGLLVFFLVTAVATFADNKPKLTLDEFFNSVSFSSLELSPDGGSVVIGTERADWDRKIAQAERAKRNDAMSGALTEAARMVVPIVETACLEDELEVILTAFADDRGVEMISKLLGWSGHGRRTLESVGNEFGITRERVRQIAAKNICNSSIRGHLRSA